MFKSFRGLLSQNTSLFICSNSKQVVHGLFKIIQNYIKKRIKNKKLLVNMCFYRLWFNLPFNKAVSTNIAKLFLRLINRHFPKSHRLHKIFNRKTISRLHNIKVRSTSCNQLTLCNCQVKEEPPMDGKFQTMDATYNCCVT